MESWQVPSGAQASGSAAKSQKATQTGSASILTFLSFGAWPSNNPQFGSTAVQEDGFKSKLTLFVKKQAGVAGEVRPELKYFNLVAVEQLEGKRMEARITCPDGTQRVLNPAGEYIPAAFLSNGEIGVVSPIQDVHNDRWGFTFWRFARP